MAVNAPRLRVTSLLRKAPDGIRLSEHLVVTDGNSLFHQACAVGLEGPVTAVPAPPDVRNAGPHSRPPALLGAALGFGSRRGER
jgi:hypothetical protein